MEKVWRIKVKKWGNKGAIFKESKIETLLIYKKMNKEQLLLSLSGLGGGEAAIGQRWIKY